MTATATNPDPAAIKLPVTKWQSETVADASDEALHKCLHEDLEAIRATLKGGTHPAATPTEDGLAPASWLKEMRRAGIHFQELALVERCTRRVEAIRAELALRESERQAEVQAKREDAEKRLRRILKNAPKKAAELEKLRQEVEPALEQVRALVRAIELVGSTRDLASRYQRLHDTAETAAKTLGEKMPDLPPVPDHLPLARETDQLIAVLWGRIDGFSKLVPPLGKEWDADAAARILDDEHD